MFQMRDVLIELKPTLRFVRAACVIILFSGVLFGCDSHAKHGPRITSRNNLYVIGAAIRDYKDVHGTLPQRLSELVPRNISPDRIGIFYVTNSFANQQV